MFKFSLEPVLDHRRTVEETRQRAHAEAALRQRALEAEREGLEEKIAASLDDVRARMREGIRYAERELTENWIRWARAECLRLLKEIERQAAEVERRRRVLVEAAKSRMIMEKLKEQEEDEHRKAEALAEQNFYDELAIREFAGRRREAKVAEDQERIAR